MVMNGGTNQQPNTQKHYIVYAQHYLEADSSTCISDSLNEMEWDVSIDNL